MEDLAIPYKTLTNLWATSVGPIKDLRRSMEDLKVIEFKTMLILNGRSIEEPLKNRVGDALKHQLQPQVVVV